MIEVLVIVPYEELLDDYRAEIEKVNSSGVNFTTSFAFGTAARSLEVVNGYDIVVVRGMTGLAIAKAYPELNIIDIHMDTSDIASSMLEVISLYGMDSKVGLILPNSQICEIALLRTLTKLDIVRREEDDEDGLDCSPLGPVDRVVSLLDRVSDIPNFGIMVDCSHIPMIGETIEANIEPIRSFVRHAHVGNTYIKDKSNPAYGDLHPRFGYPGSENDVLYVAEYLKKLLDIGYLHLGGSNALSFEVRPLPGENGDLVVANAKRTLNQAWRKVCEGSVMQSKE